MSSYFILMNDMIIMNNIEELKRFSWKWTFWPLWPLDDPCMIVTKFDRNPIKCVEEETDCQKERN